MDNMCRTCMSRHNLIPLFCEYSLNTEQLHLATGLKVERNDGLPQTICTSCTDVITSALELRQLCYQVDKTLRKLLSKQLKVKPEHDIDKIDNIFDSTACLNPIDIKTEPQDDDMIDDSKEKYNIDNVTVKEEKIIIEIDNVFSNFDSIDNSDKFNSTGNASLDHCKKKVVTYGSKKLSRNINNVFDDLEGIDSTFKSISKVSDKGIKSSKPADNFDSIDNIDKIDGIGNVSINSYKNKFRAQYYNQKQSHYNTNLPNNIKNTIADIKDHHIDNIFNSISSKHKGLKISISHDSIDDVDKLDSTAYASLADSKNNVREKYHYQNLSKNIRTLADLEEHDIDSILNSVIKENEGIDLKTSKAHDSIENKLNTKADNFNNEEKQIEKRCKTINHERNKKYMSLAVTPFDRFGPIKCKICFIRVKTQQSFMNHAARHFDPEFRCNECDRGFFSSKSYRLHKQRFHGEEKPLKCDKCPYRTCERDSLRNHVYEVHTGERPFVCNECNASFRRRTVLIQHLRKHFDKPTWQCDRCSRLFMSRSILWSHQQTVHFVNSTYSCYLCTATFKGRPAVKRHLLKVHEIPRDQQLKIKCVKTKKS